MSRSKKSESYSPNRLAAKRLLRRAPGCAFFGVLAALGTGACISTDSPLITKGGEGCDELQPGTTVQADLQVDPQVRNFMQAASDFSAIAERVHASVSSACAAIATDLGAEDTWSSLDDAHQAISNADGSGACDVAGKLIENVLVDAGKVEARVALAVSRGECHLDFDEQARCDVGCTANAQCDSGSVETRCEPGSLSVVCSAECSAGAWCMGRPERPANCMGVCESTCVGECHGSWIGKDGSRNEEGSSCNGKCQATCNGECRGRCKIDAPEGVVCGASVHCTGGCSSSFSDPVCVTEYTPPKCTVDAECHAECSARVTANAVCDPPLVELFVDVNATPQLQGLVDTLQKNLPVLISAAEADGKLAFDAAKRAGQAGESLTQRLEDLDGKSLACLGASATAIGDAIGAFDASVNASVRVTVTTYESCE